MFQKNERIKKQSSESMLGTPLPEDAEIPFISSLQGVKARSMSLANKSSALESFMKFDRKYTRVSISHFFIKHIKYKQVESKYSEITPIPILKRIDSLPLIKHSLSLST